MLYNAEAEHATKLLSPSGAPSLIQNPANVVIP